MSTAICKDGQTTITANLPMSTYRHTGVSNATALDQYATADQVVDNALCYGGASAAGTDTYAVNLAISPGAYAAGQVYSFIADVANTGACTVNYSAIGAADIKLQDGTDPYDNAIKANQIVYTQYDGTNMVLLNPTPETPATANNLAMIDANGNIRDSLVESDGAGNITADVTGNASTSTALETAQNIGITGDISAANIAFDGTGPVALNATIDAGVVGTSQLANSSVTGIKLNAMTAGTEKVSVYPDAVTVTGAGTISSGFTKHLECRVSSVGTVRVSRTHGSTTMFSYIYKNGSPAAGATGQGGSAIAYTSDVSVAEGDLLQIYANCSTDGCTGDTLSDIWVGIDAGIGIIGDWWVI